MKYWVIHCFDITIEFLLRFLANFGRLIANGLFIPLPQAPPARGGENHTVSDWDVDPTPPAGGGGLLALSIEWENTLIEVDRYLDVRSVRDGDNVTPDLVCAFVHAEFEGAAGQDEFDPAVGLRAFYPAEVNATFAEEIDFSAL